MRASLSFVMVCVNIPLPAIAQYPFRVLPFRYACHLGIPNFFKFVTLVLGFFHCFQIYIRILPATIRSILSLGFRFSLQRSNSAILSYIPLCCITRYRVSCPDYGKLVFAVCLWLSSSTLRELGYMYPFRSFPTQSREIEISD